MSPETDHLATIIWPTIEGAQTYWEPPAWQTDDDLAVSMSLPERDLVEVLVRGEIDMRTAEGFCRVVSGAASTLVRRQEDGPTMPWAWAPEVVCDLSGVRFFGASGVRALLAAMTWARDHDIALTVVASPCVRRVLTLTGLDDRMCVADPSYPGPSLTAEVA